MQRNFKRGGINERCNLQDIAMVMVNLQGHCPAGAAMRVIMAITFMDHFLRSNDEPENDQEQQGDMG